MNYSILLGIILLVAFLGRFFRLDLQSFWLDELHTVIEAGPTISWQETFHFFKCCDQHPPLFFVLDKFLLQLFGSTEFVARSLSAIAGIMGVWCMYYLGREIHSKRLGLISCLLTSFNFFHISHSQEARPYALLFLFTCLSFIYLIRMLKYESWKNTLFYSLCAVAMIYTHYFGLFVFVSQLVVFAFFSFEHRKELGKYLKHVILSTVMIFLLYLPWLPYLLSLTEIRKFWIQAISPSFAIDYFFEFFGNSDLLRPFLLLFLLLVCLSMLNVKNKQHPTNPTSYSFGLVICFIWIVITYLIPFLRSLLVMPMLNVRYAIVVLPAFIILLSIGIDQIKHNRLRTFLLSCFCILSFIDIVFIKKYYSSIQKTQFRELAEFISSEKQYPILSGATAWHQKYYLSKMGNEQKIIEGNLNAQLDSILSQKAEQNTINGFWISGAHNDQKPNAGVLSELDSSYTLKKQANLYQAWAYLYVSNENSDEYKSINYSSFPINTHFNLNGDTVAAIWNQAISTVGIPIKTGMNSMQILASGTPASEIYPHLLVLINENQIGDFYVDGYYTTYEIEFNNSHTSSAVIQLLLDNDTTNPSTGEDRNAFVKRISIVED